MFWPSTATRLENLKRKIISILGCQGQEAMMDERKGPLCLDKDRRGEKMPSAQYLWQFEISADG